VSAIVPVPRILRSAKYSSEAAFFSSSAKIRARDQSSRPHGPFLLRLPLEADPLWPGVDLEKIDVALLREVAKQIDMAVYLSPVEFERKVGLA
jgi:hypothetical protein